MRAVAGPSGNGPRGIFWLERKKTKSAMAVSTLGFPREAAGMAGKKKAKRERPVYETGGAFHRLLAVNRSRAGPSFQRNRSSSDGGFEKAWKKEGKKAPVQNHWEGEVIAGPQY